MFWVPIAVPMSEAFRPCAVQRPVTRYHLQREAGRT
jgi:hypothetical protein